MYKVKAGVSFTFSVPDRGRRSSCFTGHRMTEVVRDLQGILSNIHSGHLDLIVKDHNQVAWVYPRWR